MKLEVPQTALVRTHIEANGVSVTFLQVAIGIVDHLEKEVPSLTDEVRFLKSCLLAGKEQSQMPCNMNGDSNGSLKDSASCTRNTRKTLLDTYSSATAADDENPEDGKENKETTPPTSLPTEPTKDNDKKAKKRKNASFRGNLVAAKDVAADGKSPAVLSNGRPTWLGEIVPTWPTNDFSMSHPESEIRAMFNESFNRWDFDIFKLYHITGYRPLLFAGWEALLRCGSFSNFNFDPIKFNRFLEIVEQRYLTPESVPYHNNIHAADVTQTVWALLSSADVAKFYDPMDLTGAILSAIIHDMGHDGKNNAFHEATADELAIRYNGQSILEHFHLSSAFELLLNQKDTNILHGLRKEQVNMFRKEIIDMVLGTDMKSHFTKLSEFGDYTTRIGLDPDDWQVEDAAMFSLRNTILHVCDISNQAKPINLAEQWAARCIQEFFAQGDLENVLGLPISPLCDRATVNVEDSQIGFIGFIVKPTFEVLVKFAPAAKFCLDSVSINEAAWKKCARDVLSMDTTPDFERENFQVRSAEVRCSMGWIEKRQSSPFSGETRLESGIRRSSWATMTEQMAEQHAPRTIIKRQMKMKLAAPVAIPLPSSPPSLSPRREILATDPGKGFP